MMAVASPAARSKYTHQNATLPTTAIRNAITAPVSECGCACSSVNASLAPITTIDSPIAIRMKPWQRSAKWPPSMVQSEVRERPMPGV